MLLTACGKQSEEPLRLQALVAFPPQDTIEFALPALAHRCSDGRSLLLEAVSPEGMGVLLRLRYRDSMLTDSFRLAVPGDTAAVPAAITVVRYFIRDTPHGLVLDSGSVHVRRTGSTVGVRAEGGGVENAIHIRARIEFREVSIGTDTVPCRYVP